MVEDVADDIRETRRGRAVYESSEVEEDDEAGRDAKEDAVEVVRRRMEGGAGLTRWGERGIESPYRISRKICQH